MKSNFFVEVLDTQTITLEESYCDTVDRLREQAGECYETDNQGLPLYFSCSKKGKIFVDCALRNTDKIYRIQGKVAEIDGKTTVSIYTVKDRTVFFLQWLAILIYAAILVAYVVAALVTETLSSTKTIITIALTVSLIGITFSRTRNQTCDKAEDIEIMKNIIIQRVNAVKRWND